MRSEGPVGDYLSVAIDDLGALARQTAEFGEYLDRLPGRLVAQLLCEVRPVTDSEAQRLAGPYERQFITTMALQPVNHGAAALLLGRYVLDGGHACAMAFGVHSRAEIPDSFAQVSDVHSDWMIQEATSMVETIVDGCTEFCRPFQNTRLTDMLAAHGPPGEPTWSFGVESQHGASSSHSSDEALEPFEQRWLPWQWRV